MCHQEPCAGVLFPLCPLYGVDTEWPIAHVEYPALRTAVWLDDAVFDDSANSVSDAHNNWRFVVKTRAQYIDDLFAWGRIGAERHRFVPAAHAWVGGAIWCFLLLIFTFCVHAEWECGKPLILQRKGQCFIACCEDEQFASSRFRCVQCDTVQSDPWLFGSGRRGCLQNSP